MSVSVSVSVSVPVPVSVSVSVKLLRVCVCIYKCTYIHIYKTDGEGDWVVKLLLKCVCKLGSKVTLFV